MKKIAMDKMSPVSRIETGKYMIQTAYAHTETAVRQQGKN